MGIDESLTNEIVRRILTVARPDKIILFGSAASSLMTSDSDIDLLVVEDHIADRRGEYVRIRTSLRGMGYPFDIFLISTQSYQTTKDLVGGIAYPAARQGRVIYEAA
ncbi:MAG: nucleotidyltransferase domain-containing protein [Deltaproteobacteria bacterium]|nr:nucleotidyltransferase domain-containing protein [Deltaproteobacteria bacterium]